MSTPRLITVNVEDVYPQDISKENIFSAMSRSDCLPGLHSKHQSILQADQIK